MKILNIHKHYFYRDGASTYFLDVQRLLESEGHFVVPFAMKHKQNLKSIYQKYFVSEVDYRNRKGVVSNAKKAARFVYSTEAAQNLEKLIKDHGPFDVAHVHNIYHHLTPSILPVLKKHKIPVVMTVHDYKLVSSDYTLVAKRSVSEKALGGLERMLHQLLKSYDKNIDLFIAPSKYMMNFCVKAGWPKKRFVQLPYMIDTNSWKFARSDNQYVAYAGRLSHEKGVGTLLAAAHMNPQIDFRIAGTGADERRLKKLAKDYQLNNVQFVGFLHKKELRDLIRHSMVVVVPSQWPENYPMSVLEAQAMGKLVIGARVGGIPEQIVDGKTGLLFTAGNAEELSDALARAFTLTTPQKHGIGLHARQWVIDNHSLDVHYKKLIKLYAKVAA